MLKRDKNKKKERHIKMGQEQKKRDTLKWDKKERHWNGTRTKEKRDTLRTKEKRHIEMGQEQKKERHNYNYNKR